MTTEHIPQKKIERLYTIEVPKDFAATDNIMIGDRVTTGTIKMPMWTEKGWTKDCQCGAKINYLSKICPYCHERRQP